MGDTVEYATHGGILVQKLFLARDLRRIFAYRHERLRKRFGGSNPQDPTAVKQPPAFGRPKNFFWRIGVIYSNHSSLKRLNVCDISAAVEFPRSAGVGHIAYLAVSSPFGPRAQIVLADDRPGIPLTVRISPIQLVAVVESLQYRRRPGRTPFENFLSPVHAGIHASNRLTPSASGLRSRVDREFPRSPVALQSKGILACHSHERAAFRLALRLAVERFHSELKRTKLCASSLRTINSPRNAERSCSGAPDF